MTKQELLALSADQLRAMTYVDMKTEDCADCERCEGCTRCTYCKDCTVCTVCTSCTSCALCADDTLCTGCTFCTGCTGCTGCMGIADGSNLQYVAFGIQLTEGEYAELRKKMHNDQR